MTGLAIVGASERTIWTEWLTRTLETYGYGEPIWLVNPKYNEILGRSCFPSVEALPETPKCAVVVIGAERALVECEKLLDLGVEEIVVISNGFGETLLPEGKEREARLREICAGKAARVVGPNCVGFARFHENLCALAQPVPLGIHPGDVSVISQSGGLTGVVLGALHREGLGIDLCYSIGNSVAFGLEDALEWALSRSTTRIVCAVIESIRENDRFERAIERAHEEGKELICVTLGNSAGGRSAALSHTGQVIGQQRLVGAYLKRLEVFVADNVQEQARLASLLHTLGRPDRDRGVFVINTSGGGAVLAADVASRNGVPMARLSRETTAKLREMIPPGPYIGNPLDVTGNNGPGGAKPVYDVVCADPGVGMLIEPYVLPWPTDQLANRWHRDALERVVEAADTHHLPVLFVSCFEQELSDWAREFARHPRVSVASGLEETMSALAKLYSTQDSAGLASATESTDSHADHAGRELLGEAEGRAILEAAGLHFTPGGVAESEDAAVELASVLRAPVVVKLGVRGVAHKSRVGGVQVGLVDECSVRRAYRAIAESARDNGIVVGGDVPVIVAEMAFGPELLVGAIRDPIAGPTVTVAVGGWAAESGRPFGTVALPLGEGDATRLLAEWRLPPLVGNRRAAAFGTFLERLAKSFTSGSLAKYSTVEINPVILSFEGAVAADVLLVR